MAQPTNTYDSYDMVGIREDLEDVIYDVSPEETPFYSRCKKVKATQSLHEWQTDALRNSAENAHIEGDDTTADARTPTTRLGNYAQIFKNAVVIPDSDDTTDKAGRGSEMSYQIMKEAAAQKLDIEKALFANNAKEAGSSTTPRELAGVPSWMITNVNFQSGNGGASPTGDGTDARTDDGTPTAFSQTKFDSVMQMAYTNGGRKIDTCYLSPFQMNAALGFVGNNNQRSQVQASEGRVSKLLSVYLTPWGDVAFQPSLENRSRDVFVLDSEKWKIAVKRPTKNVELAKTGDNTKRQIVTELTLVAANEKASAAVYDNTTSQ